MIDLMRFCANESNPRDYLRKPWKHGDWVYATNGHVCVRVPAEAMPDVAECDKAPNALALFQKHLERRDCQFLLMPPIPGLIKCGGCDGVGRVFAAKCSDCTDGQFRHGSHVYECMNCEGSPAGAGWLHLNDEPADSSELQRPCEYCNGLGHSIRHNAGKTLGDASYSTVYLSWLAALPQIRVCPGNSADVKSADQVPAVFLFDGGQALLMPRKE